MEAYLGNPNLKRVNVPQEFSEENIIEYNKCSNDPLYFIENFVRIVSLDHGLVPFDMYEDDLGFYMDSSWANVNRKGDYNETHFHGNSHWSCAYYVTGTYTAPIYFIDPRIRAEMFSAVDAKTIGLEKSVPGQALFFPAWLQHAVHHNLTDNPRISISCNFVLIEG